MASKVSLNVEGIDKLVIRLEKIETGATEAAAKTAKEIAKAVVVRAKEIVPVKTGALQRSIRSETGESGEAYVKAGR